MQADKLFSWNVQSTKINIQISPFSLLGYLVDKIILNELIGGELGNGEIYFQKIENRFLKTVDMGAIYDLDMINIKISDLSIDTSYDIYGWVTNKESLNDLIIIKFIIIPFKGNDKFGNREFFTCPISEIINTDSNPNNLKSIIQLLWDGDIEFDIRCDTDLTEIPEFIWQRNETNCELLTKLLYSYKNNSVFGYSLSGGFIKDINKGLNWKHREEPNLNTILIGGSNIFPITGLSRNNEYILHLNILTPWTEDCSNNIQVYKFNDDISYYHPDCSLMMYNYISNKRIMSSSFFSSFDAISTIKLPWFKLGDVVRYTNKSDGKLNKEILFMNTSNTFFISGNTDDSKDLWGNKYSVKSTFRGLEENESSQYPTDRYPELEMTNIFDIRKIAN